MEWFKEFWTSVSPYAFAATVMLFGVLGILLSAMIATYQLWLWPILQKWAARDHIVTNVEEGRAKIRTQGGQAVSVLTARYEKDPKETWNVEGKAGDKGGKSVLLAPPRPLSKIERWIEKNILPGGMRWVGFPFMGYGLYDYNFRWSQLRSNKPGEEDGLLKEGVRELKDEMGNGVGKWVVPFAKHIDYVFLKDSVYYLEVRGAETKGATADSVGMPIDVHITTTMRVVDPYLALMFGVHDWRESTDNALRPTIRKWIADHSYEEVVKKPEWMEGELDEILNMLIPSADLAKLNEERKKRGQKPIETPVSVGEYIELRYGIGVKRVAFEEVIPPAAYTKAATDRAIADQEKVRIAILAAADRDRRITIAEGDAKAIEIEVAAIKAGGPEAMRLRELEAFEHASEKGNMVINGSPASILISPPGRSNQAQ